MFWRWFHCRDVISRWVDLHMTLGQVKVFWPCWNSLKRIKHHLYPSNLHIYKLYQTISMTSSKSKNLFQSFLLTKFPKSIKLLTRQNRKENINSTWLLRDHQENRLLSLWVPTMLKEVKLEVSVDFICLDNKDLLLTMNKVIASFDLNVIEKY